MLFRSGIMCEADLAEVYRYRSVSQQLMKGFVGVQAGLLALGYAAQSLLAPSPAAQLLLGSLLLLAGGAAAKSVLQRDEGILSLRGRWFEWKSEDGALELPAMPTLHPAFLLRQPAQKRLAWRDLLSLRQMLDAH